MKDRRPSPAARRRHATLWSLILILALSLALPLGGHFYAGIASAQSPDATQQNPRSNYWRDVRRGVEGYTSVPGPEMDVLIQDGQNWRQLRNGWVVNYGGWALFVIVLAIALFFTIKGPQRIEAGRSGVKVRRWHVLDRMLHWFTAILFVLLAVTGLSLLFGRSVLIPVMGLEGFSTWAGMAMGLHNALGPVFAVAVVVMIAAWMRHNIPDRSDLQWLREGGGIFKKAHPDAGFANAGEKIWFWFICTVGLVVIATGLVMNFPNLGFTRGDMQLANLIHATTACLWVALWFGHACIGTIGTEGALEGMTSGYVDENWARQHHNLWLEEQERKGTLVRVREGEEGPDTARAGHGAAPGSTA